MAAGDEETDTLLREVSRDISEDDLEADQVLTPRDAGRDGEGTILWLKTFNIRTSTLSFAKAIANYTTSLKEHYRSFPEIIDYSNEFFTGRLSWNSLSTASVPAPSVKYSVLSRWTHRAIPAET